jgi:hypothetical protein
VTSVFDPTATFAVHCGNGFDADITPSKSRLSRYNAVSSAWGRNAGARVHYSDQLRTGDSHAKIHAYCRSWNVAFVKVIEGDLGSRT